MTPKTMEVEIESKKQLERLGADKDTIKHYEAIRKQGLNFYVRLDDNGNIVETSNVKF